MEFHRIEVRKNGSVLGYKDIRMFQVAMSNAISRHLIEQILNLLYGRFTLFRWDILIPQKVIQTQSLNIFRYQIGFPY